MMEEMIMRHPDPDPDIVDLLFGEEEAKLTIAAQLQGSNLKRKILNMTDGEAYTYLNKMKLDAYQEGYQEGYADCLRKD